MSKRLFPHRFPPAMQPTTSSEHPRREESETQGLETARGALFGIFGGCAFWILVAVAAVVIAGIYSI
jgi:hypothetical protein